MASTIRIKRSPNTGAPSALSNGEMGYTFGTGTVNNGGDRLYIGHGNETGGIAANISVIGGKYFTDLLDHAPGTLTATSALLVDVNKKINELFVDNLKLDENTLSTTDTNGNLSITPNGTGKTVITNLHINDVNTSIAEFIYDTVGGAVTGGTGITITNNDNANTSTVSITNTTVTAGDYGSATAIPTFTVNAQGQLTAAGTVALATTLNVAGDTGTSAFALLTDTITFVGGTGITSVVAKVGTATSVTFDIDSTVATLTGTQTFTNKTINLGVNTLIATSAQLAAAITDETGTGSLVFATSPVLVTPTLGAALATSITATTGNLVINAAAGNNSVSIVPTGTGSVDVSNKRITSVAEPTQSSDAATKNYVDAVKTGLDVKDSVRVTTTANLTATYSNGASGVGATLTNSGTQAALTIDSIVLAVGERVLVKDQTSALQNGFYVVSNAGSASTNWILTRSLDADQNTEITPGAFTFVEEGTVGNDNGYVCTNVDGVVIGTTAITFVQFSGAGQITAGAGLTKNANTIDAVGTANRIAISADAIDIASTYVGQTSITTLGTIGTGVWQGTLIGPTYGGTGVNNGTKTITLGGNLVTSGAFNTTLTSTATTSVILPTTGTLATLDGAEALSNKTITASSFSGTAISGSGLIAFTNTTDATALNVAAVEIDGGLSVAKSMFIGTNITGAGASISTLDGFNIDGGTY